MVMYAEQYHGAIVGNASTSANFLVPPHGPVVMNDNTTVPEVTQVWDWTCPIAKVLGVKFDETPVIGTVSPPTGRTGRFMQMSAYKPFICPEANDIIMGPYSSSPIKVNVLMCSYVTSLFFQYGGYSTAGNGAGNGLLQNYLDTGSYFPNIIRVGDTSRKIFMADGAKYTDSSGTAPNYNLAWAGGGTPGGVYSDVGPWDPDTRAYYPSQGIVLGMRHGDRHPSFTGFSATNNSTKYRMNVAFFDCHVESMDGHSASNPCLWLPKGTKLVTGSDLSANSEAYVGFIHSSPFIVP
jgi:prepilin-type processing-associated H-X9-DG protein